MPKSDVDTILKELREEYEEKFEDIESRLKKLESGGAKKAASKRGARSSPKSEGGVPTKVSDLTNCRKAELEELAEEHGVTLTGTTKKDHVEDLKKHFGLGRGKRSSKKKDDDDDDEDDEEVDLNKMNKTKLSAMLKPQLVDLCEKHGINPRSKNKSDLVEALLEYKDTDSAITEDDRTEIRASVRSGRKAAKEFSKWENYSLADLRALVTDKKYSRKKRADIVKWLDENGVEPDDDDEGAREESGDEDAEPVEVTVADVKKMKKADLIKNIKKMSDQPVPSSSKVGDLRDILTELIVAQEKAMDEGSEKEEDKDDDEADEDGPSKYTKKSLSTMTRSALDEIASMFEEYDAKEHGNKKDVIEFILENQE